MAIHKVVSSAKAAISIITTATIKNTGGGGKTSALPQL